MYVLESVKLYPFDRVPHSYEVGTNFTLWQIYYVLTQYIRLKFSTYSLGDKFCCSFFRCSLFLLLFFFLLQLRIRLRALTTNLQELRKEKKNEKNPYFFMCYFTLYLLPSSLSLRLLLPFLWFKSFISPAHNLNHCKLFRLSIYSLHSFLFFFTLFILFRTF